MCRGRSVSKKLKTSLLKTRLDRDDFVARPAAPSTFVLRFTASAQVFRRIETAVRRQTFDRTSGSRISRNRGMPLAPRLVAGIARVKFLMRPGDSKRHSAYRRRTDCVRR